MADIDADHDVTADITVNDLRILVAEDESLIALDVETMLQAIGCEVVGPVGPVDEIAKATRNLMPSVVSRSSRTWLECALQRALSRQRGDALGAPLRAGETVR